MAGATSATLPLRQSQLTTVGIDIHFILLQHCTFETLAMLRGTSRYWKNRVEIYINSLWNITLAEFFTDVISFRNILDDTASIISGSLILFIILQATSFRRWTPSDMDLYCPIHAVLHILHYLREHEGYVASNTDRDLSQRPVRDYFGGIAAVIKLTHPARGTHIDVVCSSRASSTFPLAYFWGTPVMNFFTGHSLCISYPLWTLRGLGCLRPTTPMDQKVSTCAFKYAQRGFSLASFSDAAWTTTRHTRNPTYCAHDFRAFGDHACMTITFSTTHQTHKDPQSCPVWSFGGGRCLSCTRSSDGCILLFHQSFCKRFHHIV